MPGDEREPLLHPDAGVLSGPAAGVTAEAAQPPAPTPHGPGPPGHLRAVL
jgi:hypothetical protein